jgi:hypothetical protein
MHIRSANNYTASVAKWGNDNVLEIKCNKKPNIFHIQEKLPGQSELDRTLSRTRSRRGYEPAARQATQ